MGLFDLIYMQTPSYAAVSEAVIATKYLKKVYAKTLQYECYKLFSNLRALAKSKEKRKVGRLRFKGKGRFKTFTYNQKRNS